jgi:hypothetical protein
MLRRSWVGVVLVVGLLAAPVRAQDQVKLEWKLNEGDKFYVEDVSTLKQKIEIMGKVIDQTIKTTMITSYTVKKKTDEGTLIEQKFEDVVVKQQGGLGVDIGQYLEKLKGGVFKLTVGKGGKLTKFEGYDDFIKKITMGAGEGAEDAGKYIRLVISEDVMRNAFEEVYGFVPPEPVKKGDSWKRNSTLPLGPLGSFKIDKTYTLEGKEDANAKIGLKANMSYVLPKGGAGLGALFKVARGNLKGEGARGNLYFDVEKGRLSRYAMSMIIRGTLTLDVMGNNIDMEITMDQSTNSRVLNRNPAQGRE